MEANKDVIRAYVETIFNQQSGTGHTGTSAATAAPPWTDEHTCPPEARETGPSLRIELRRLTPPTELEPRPKAGMLP